MPPFFYFERNRDLSPRYSECFSFRSAHKKTAPPTFRVIFLIQDTLSEAHISILSHFITLDRFYIKILKKLKFDRFK